MSVIDPCVAASDTSRERDVAIVGSTGSIGTQTLRVMMHHPERFRLTAITACDNVVALAAQARTFKPKRAVIANDKHYAQLKSALAGSGVEAAAGDEAVTEAATMGDIVMSAIVGMAGLKPTLAAIRRGQTVALANKECLVAAGELMMREVKAHGATLIPVDSEHNAIFQLLAGRSDAIERLTITASGGPFRTWTLAQMKKATPAQAVRHPKWNMGAKISVDSATLMNKGLEMIEAYRLFPVRAEHIGVLVHPESIVHSLVHYADGSVLAQMANPDMCTPIAHALAWPERIGAPVKPLDLAAVGALHFEAPDPVRFPALRLARAALMAGGGAPAALNAANEIAVKRFLGGAIGFLDIVKIVEKALETEDNAPVITLDDVFEIDRRTRLLAESL